MERLLQAIVRKFIKRVDFNKVKLVEVQHGPASDFDDSVTSDADFHVFKIKYNFLTIGAVVTIINRANGTKYLSNIDINPAFRSMGIGGYILKRYFSGYYIMADNDRTGRLYQRLGKHYSKFTRDEFEAFISTTGLRGVWKLDHAPRRRYRRY